MHGLPFAPHDPIPFDPFSFTIDTKIFDEVV
jgi:hypothetical protein